MSRVLELGGCVYYVRGLGSVIFLGSFTNQLRIDPPLPLSIVVGHFSPNFGKHERRRGSTACLQSGVIASRQVDRQGGPSRPQVSGLGRPALLLQPDSPAAASRGLACHPEQVKQDEAEAFSSPL